MSISSDREHHRILYVISVLEGKAILWGFTMGKLIKIESASVNERSKIIPFFSPSEKT